MALSISVSYLKEFKVPVRTDTPSTFGWILNGQNFTELYQQPFHGIAHTLYQTIEPKHHGVI